MSWDSWRVNERLIRVPDELPNPPAELAFMNCKWTIVEISEKNWNRIDKPNSVVYGETTNVVFRIIKENGQYYYSYMYFTQCYGNYCKYFQDFDSNGNEKDLFVDYVSGTPDFTEAPGIRLMAAVCRLFRSEMLSPTDKYEYCSDVKRFAKDWARHVVLFDCPDLLEALFRMLICI